MRELILYATFLAAALSAQTRTPHTLHGKVTQVDPAAKRLTVLNEPVAGWMGGMTMGYAVSNPAILDRLHPGDQITATVYDGDTGTLYDVAPIPQAPTVTTKSALRLEDLEAMATSGHPSIAQAEAKRRASEGLARQAGLYPNPTVGYYSDEVPGGYTAGGKQGAFASQTIVLGGKLGAARRVAQLEVDQAGSNVDLQRTRLLAEVRSAFYRVLAAQKMADVRHRLATLAADSAETARQFFNVGQADRPDVLAAEVEQQKANLDARNAEQYLDSVWHVLAAIVGKPGLPLATLEGDLDALPDLTREESVALALSQSPEIHLAQQAIARTEASLTLAGKVSIPDLAISANLAQNFQPLETTSRSTGLQGGVQIGVQIPLFNRNQGNIAAARAEIESARAELERQKLHLERRVTAIYSDYQSARQTVLIYKTEMLPRATESWRLYQTGYQNMAATWPQALMAQRTLFQLEADLVRTQEAAWQSALSLRSFGISLAVQ